MTEWLVTFENATCSFDNEAEAYQDALGAWEVWLLELPEKYQEYFDEHVLSNRLSRRGLKYETEENYFRLRSFEACFLDYALDNELEPSPPVTVTQRKIKKE